MANNNKKKKAVDDLDDIIKSIANKQNQAPKKPKTTTPNIVKDDPIHRQAADANDLKARYSIFQAVMYRCDSCMLLHGKEEGLGSLSESATKRSIGESKNEIYRSTRTSRKNHNKQ